MAEGISFDGISQVENGEWVATFGEWTESYPTEWEAIVARDIHALETDGDEAPTNLSRVAIRDMIRRGGWDYIRSEKGVLRCLDLVGMAKLRKEGPLPELAEPAPRGQPMKKAAKRQSRFKGVHQAVDRWQAKLGTRYVGSAPDEKVTALMRDIAALDRLFEELNYPIGFVMEARIYGVKGLQKVATLALFINRLDQQLAVRDAEREAIKAGEDPRGEALRVATEGAEPPVDEADDIAGSPAMGEPSTGPAMPPTEPEPTEPTDTGGADGN